MSNAACIPHRVANDRHYQECMQLEHHTWRFSIMAASNATTPYNTFWLASLATKSTPF